MKRFYRILIVIFLIMVTPIITLADEIGARAIGMGGAYTAIADDGSAPYWNPAGITLIKSSTFTSSFGEGGKYEKANDVIDISGLPVLTNNVFQLSSLNYFGVNGNVNDTYFAINYLSDIEGNSTINSNTLSVIGEKYEFKTLTLAGNLGNQLKIGINAKTIQATIVESAEDPLGNGYKSSSTGDGMAYDIGILYLLNNKTRLGFMGRNIFGNVNWSNGKTINYINAIETNTTAYNPSENLSKSYILGIAYNPNKTLTLAADAEMIDASNDTNDQTRFHIGMEQTALWNSVTLRLGAYTNKDEQASLTGGLGFKLGLIILDVAYVSAKTTEEYLTADLKF